MTRTRAPPAVVPSPPRSHATRLSACSSLCGVRGLVTTPTAPSTCPGRTTHRGPITRRPEAALRRCAPRAPRRAGLPGRRAAPGAGRRVCSRSEPALRRARPRAVRSAARNRRAARAIDECHRRGEVSGRATARSVRRTPLGSLRGRVVSTSRTEGLITPAMRPPLSPEPLDTLPAAARRPRIRTICVTFAVARSILTTGGRSNRPHPRGSTPDKPSPKSAPTRHRHRQEPPRTAANRQGRLPHT